MKIVGTIVEYNPLHNGHIYAINQIKKESNADLLIAVMSTNITMRGDLSLFDKFTKTKQALLAGIDIVIELPICYTIHNSDIFAYNSIHYLNIAKVDEIWIGSESNNPEIFKEAYNEFNKTENQHKIKERGEKYVLFSEILPIRASDPFVFSFCWLQKSIRFARRYDPLADRGGKTSCGAAV